MATGKVIEIREHPAFKARERKRAEKLNVPVSLDERYNFYLLQSSLAGFPPKSYKEWFAG